MGKKLVTKASLWAGKTWIARLIGYSVTTIDNAWASRSTIDNRFAIERRDCPVEEKTHHRQQYQYRTIVTYTMEADDHIDSRYTAWEVLKLEDAPADDTEKEGSDSDSSGNTALSAAEQMMIHMAKRSGLLNINSEGPQKSVWMPASRLQAKLGISSSKWHRALRGAVEMNYTAIEKRDCPDDRRVNANQKYEYRFVVAGRATEGAEDEPVRVMKTPMPESEIGFAMLAPQSSATRAFAMEVAEELQEIANMLIEKNRKYGDSALSPKRVFSKAGAVEQIRVRIDDKLSRMANQQTDEDEDVVKDLIGYLMLLRIATKREKQNR